MSSKLILLINEGDSKDLDEIVSVCLSYVAGWNVISISSTQENLGSVLNRPPDLIIFNAALHKMNELSFTQKLTIQNLKEHLITQFIPIVLLTDTANWLTPKELQFLGITKAITKPFDPSTLVTQINQIFSEIEKRKQDGERGDR